MISIRKKIVTSVCINLIKKNVTFMIIEIYDFRDLKVFIERIAKDTRFVAK